MSANAAALAPYGRVKQYLLDALARGRWAPGELMPSEADLVIKIEHPRRLIESVTKLDAVKNLDQFAPFREVMELRLGDPLYLETADGWYTYRFRSLEYVLPSETDVLNPFPRMTVEAGDDRILTLTTCHPKANGTEERAIAYAVLDDFRPRSEGPPKSLVEADSNVARRAA